jgi:lysine 2,3-aminomutase
MTKIITKPDDILKYLPKEKCLTVRIDEAKEAIRNGHQFAITEFYLSKIIKGDPEHILLNAVLPSIDDLEVLRGMHTSVEEVKISASEYMIQKYQPNSIVTLTTKCAQYCTYCFRKQHDPKSASVEEISKIVNDIENAGEGYMEVIFSGGDPLMVNPILLEYLAEKISAVREKKKLLIGLNTRVPIVNPKLCHGQKLKALEKIKPGNVGLHILHPDEITEEFKEACYALRENTYLNFRTTHPLLKGINDDSKILTDMYQQLAEEINAVPKDLIVPIPTGAGKAKRLSLERCMEIMRDLHYNLPGNLLPRLIVCSPVYGKSYLDPFHTKKDGSFGYDISQEGTYLNMHIKDGSCLQKCKAIK